MKQVIDYIVITTDEVHRIIKEGWQPWGAPFFGVQIGDDVYMYQAMVKYNTGRISDPVGGV